MAIHPCVFAAIALVAVTKIPFLDEDEMSLTTNPNSPKLTFLPSRTHPVTRQLILLSLVVCIVEAPVIFAEPPASKWPEDIEQALIKAKDNRPELEKP